MGITEAPLVMVFQMDMREELVLLVSQRAKVLPLVLEPDLF